MNPLNVWRLIVAWWRRWDAQRKAARAQRRAARARWERREDMAYTVEVILDAPTCMIDRAIADLERQIQDVRADTE